MPETVLICAIWLVTSALSSGFSGSWFCICATSSLRKRSALPASLAALAFFAAAVAAAVPDTESIAVAMVCFRFGCYQDWPICNVLSSRPRAVFITSMLFW